MKDLNKDQSDLDRLIKVAIGAAAEMFDDMPASISIPAVCVFKGKDGVTPIFFHNEVSREDVIGTIRAIFDEQEATAYAFAYEGWYKIINTGGLDKPALAEMLRTEKRPSEDIKNRKPCFVVTGADQDGNRIGASYDIEVKGNRRLMTKQISNVTGDYVKGIWSDLLKKKDTEIDVDSIGSGIHGLKG